VKDLADIPDNIKNRLDIQPVKWIEQVLEAALERMPEPLSEESAETVKVDAPVAVSVESEVQRVIKH
jgi:ATP-dependent Lon protease